MAEYNTDELTVRKGRQFFLHPDFYVPLILLAFTTAIFNLFPIDIAVQRLFYSDSGHWSTGNKLLFQLLYRYASFPALILAVGGLFLFIRSFRHGQGRRWRMVGLFLILAMAIGPGLIVNSLLKDRWGRPRPRDIVQFGGKYAYEAPLEHDSSSPGKSFPSGHASMGFYFYTLYFLLRGRKARPARFAFLFATSFGLLIGLGRVTQGGHFSSDIIWAGGLVYLCTAIIFHVMGMVKNIWWQERAERSSWQLPVIYQVGIYLLGALIAALVFLATPFYRQSEYSWVDKSPVDKPQAIHFAAKHLDLRIGVGTESMLRTDTSGFGFPGSKITFARDIVARSGTSEVSIRQIKRGIFTELNCLANLSIDSLRAFSIQARVEKGDINLSMKHFGNTRSFNLEVGSGDITLQLPKPFQDTLRVDGFPRIVTSRKDISIAYGRRLSTKPWQVKIARGKLLIK
jgi:membrane-associated PAP2 superfamily phosphatase